MARYSLGLFGGFDLKDGDGAVIPIRSKKGRCLLAYLALSRGQKMGRDVLAALLWGDRGDAQARRSLSQELYRLRGLFPEDVQDGFVLEAESVALDDGLFDVDVIKFEQRLESGDGAAAALFSGELLAGLEANQEAFDDWLRGERERLRERAIAGLHEEMRAHLDDAPERAAEAAGRILTLDAASEPAHRALMQLHSRAGRRDLALKQYEKCRTLLADELGIEPDGATTALYEKIKTVTVPPEAAAPAEEAAAQPDAPTAERRQVTVMAAGLVLDPTLRGELDPEDRSKVTRICSDVAAALLERNGSRIAKTMGDSLLAYFGYPEAREDDAERAARAGLEIVQEIAALDLPSGVKTRCRVGIASGLVIAGEGEEETLVGEAPDMAARLLQVAEPGGIVVSAATRELLASGFALEALEDVTEGESAWRLFGEAHTESRFEAHRSGALTPFVGRELELLALDHRWGQAEDGEGQVVLISGEPGIGKSRIAETIHERLPAEGHIRLLYQCSPHHTNSALRPVIEQLSFAAGLGADEPDENRLDKLEALIAQATDSVSSVAALFADLLSIRHNGRYPALNLTPQAQKERTLEALVAQLTGLAARKPVLFVFEDLHWADPTTREFLDLTVKGIEESRVLVLFTFRPEYEAPWVGQSHATLMALNRLSKRQCGEMAQSVAAVSRLSEAAIAEIVSKTDGVPLFVEELTKTMLGGEKSEAVPATIQASLTARLDQLGPAREVAQVGAVIGRTFSYELIAGVSEAASDDIDAALIKLEEAGLVIRRGSPPHASYTFKHALVQDAAYESLLKSTRRSLHARVAETLEAISPNTAETQPELLAHHFGEAGITGLAIQYWRQAAERATERSANVEAISHASKGLELLGAIDEEQDRLKLELDLQVMLGNAFLAIRGFSAPETGETFRRAYELCQELGDKRRIFPILLGLHGFHDVRAEHDKSTIIGQEALELARGETQHVAPMVTALQLRGENSFWLGNLRQAIEYYDSLDEIYDLDGPRISTSEYSEEPGLCAKSEHAWLLSLIGYADKAKETAKRTVEAASKLQHAQTTAYVIHGAMWVALERGDLAHRRGLLKYQLAFCEEQRLSFWFNWAIFLKDHVDCVAGGDAADIDKIRASAARMEDQFGLIMAPSHLSLVAAVCADRGLQTEGLDACQRAFDIVEQTGERHYEAEVHRVNGLLLAPELGGDAKPAEECFVRALDVARNQSAKTLELRAARDLARLWHGQGRSEEARGLLAPVYGWFSEGFDTADLKRAKAMLDVLG